MKQRRIVTVLAIIAVTGAVSVPNSLAMAWWLDVNDRHVVDRGGLEWNPMIHTVDDPKHDPEYQTLGHPEHGPIPFTSRQAEEYKSGSSSNEGRYGPNSSEKELSGASKSPSGGSGYGGIPTLPSADPMLEELSRAPR
ncbi:MAG: hypothetical protein OJF51_003194 [Nitrospira sp.]|jgi:hypothetical protein|nr:MAG: hypothetical protein OJF51_003194 [Nitrospira sp.]